MKFQEGFIMALKNISSSKMRTTLTMLGIIIGVLAVILIVGIGNGLTGYIEQSFEEMGTNILTVSVSGRGASTRTVDDDQMYQIVADNPEYLAHISPTVTVSGTLKIDSDTIDSTTITGIGEDYLTLKQYPIAEGRDLSYGDMEYRNNNCVVGAYFAQTYFMGNALGQTLQINGNNFTIVGIAEATTDDMEEGGTDDAIYLPYTTATRLNGSAVISSYSVAVVDEEQLDMSQAIIEAELYDIFGSDDAYRVFSIGSILDTMTEMVDVLVYVLAGIAAISLLVGGIGIMNIMLVSVTERTREIGIRKSLGAKESTILQQFVIEAAVTSALGGILGIVLGYLLCGIASPIASQLLGSSFTIDPGVNAVLLAFSISAAIGILFGYLPAKKAARLNPIDALRF